MSYTEGELILPRNVEDEMKDSYLRYSMSVIISRALPDVRDGLKPSQRRILFAMRQLNLGPQAKHRKCAKVCGDTSGDYHPHGESVIYPTLVRMAQDWSMRYRLIDGQGNFGSIDGDPPAAMRYTEARLTAPAVLLMEDLDKETVDMVPNYDETKKEPTVFPARFPNLLCNGSSGIAVGMATNIPSHNLGELCSATMHLLDNPEASIDDIMQIMPGPDFPTGGVICGYRGIKEAYHTGRGKLCLRGVMHQEEMEDSDRLRLVIDEIPYAVNKTRLIESIAELINNKQITSISDLRDESDKDGMRIVMELKRGEIPDVTINQLYKYTDMQTTFGCNMLALDKGLPRTMNIKQMISAWIVHRIEVIRRRTRFELNKAEARAHILEGYLKAIDCLDEVVRLIRQSSNRDEARIGLINEFTFTLKQANAILDLRLYQLTGMEHDKIQEEYDQLLKNIAYYKSVLASEALVRGIIKDELEDIRKQKRADRMTKIMPAEGEFSMEDLISNEQAVITISSDDYIKRMPMDTFREQRRGGQGVTGFDQKKESDEVKDVYVASTHDHLLIFTNHGRVYRIKVWQIPETGRKSKGKPLVQLLDELRPDEKIATILPLQSLSLEDSYIFMATRKGVVKKTSLDAFENIRRKGIFALSIDEGDEVITARLATAGQQVMLFTHNGMAVRFEHTDVRSMGRLARGVRGIALRSEGDFVVGCEVVNPDDSILIVCEKGYGKRTYVSEYRQTKRGGVGVRSIICNERNGKVVGAMVTKDEDGVLLMSNAGQTVRISLRDVRIIGRATQGIRLVNLKSAEALVVAIQKIDSKDMADATDVAAVPEQEILAEENLDADLPTDTDLADDDS